MASWFPIVPLRTKRAASCFVREAICSWRELVVSSSWNTSSRRVVLEIAASMEAVGVVTTSLRKSKAATPGPDHALIFLGCEEIGGREEEEARPFMSEVSTVEDILKVAVW